MSGFRSDTAHGHPVALRRARDQSIVETLMIPLAMMVLDELRDYLPEVSLTDGNDANRHARHVAAVAPAQTAQFAAEAPILFNQPEAPA